MAKIYNLKVNHDVKINSYCAFDSQQFETDNTTTYLGVLNVLRKAFNMVDMPFLMNKSK